MLKKTWLAREVRKQIYEIRYYNRYGKRDMMARNMIALKLINTLGFVVTLFIFALSKLSFTSWEIKWHYWVLMPMFAVFLIFSFAYGRRENKSYAVVQAAGIVFSLTYVALLTTVSVFYYPNEPEEMVYLIIVLLPLFFCIETWVVGSICVWGGVAFCVLAYIYKDPSVVQHDIYTVALSIALSLTVLAYHARIRANGFIVKEKYKKLSHTDLLTGLLNKRSYEQWCQKLLDEREEKDPCALVIFDLDNFKNINDTYGHLMGDKALEIVGKTLLSHFNADGLVGRIGGDEFSVFVCTPGGCGRIAERAEHVMAELTYRAETELDIVMTMSMGLSEAQSELTDYSKLYINADRGLYAFKRAPRYEQGSMFAK